MLTSVGFRDVAASASSRIICPLCTYDQCHIVSWKQIDVDPGEAAVYALGFEGGCGCLWEIRFKILSGAVDSHLNVLRPCINRAGLLEPTDPESAARALEGHEL